MGSRPIAGLTLNYRDPARTRACVLALVDAGIRRIVVFDNSESGHGQVQAAEMPSLPEAELEIIHSSRNLGFAAGVNEGIARGLARWPGHWILLVNNDALVPRGLPEQLSKALSSDPSAALAFPPLLQNGVRISWSWYQPWLGLATVAKLPGSFPYASGCCQLLAPERVGERPFDEDFFMYGEDVALAWRLAQEQRCQLLVEGSEVVHEGSASSRRGSLLYESLMVEGHVRLARKFAGGRAGRHAVMLALRALVLPSRALVRSLRARSVVPFRGMVLGARRAFANSAARSVSGEPGA